MTLTPSQRDVLDTLDEHTEGTFLTEQYAGMLLPKLRELADAGEPLVPDDAIRWARERERGDDTGWMLAGIAFAVRHWDRGQPGHPL